MSPKDTSDLISALGPSERHRNDIRQSWFGTLVGQSTVAVGMVVAYLAAIGLLYTHVGNALDRLQTSNPILFYGGIGLPLALVAAVSLLPAALRARRERRLRPLARNDTPPEPGYFRLHPYDSGDAGRYTRSDGALAEALAWLEGTDAPVLYLSGASGSGKSSLVNAGLAPALRDKGWAVLFVRGRGTPLTALTEALRQADALFAKPPSSRAGLRTLLTRAGEERARAGAGPLLIVMDQFEEFLILDAGAEKDGYASFLRELAADPVPNLRLLHVFRSDYRDLIFRERLPDYIDRATAFSLPAFTRKDAEAFLHDGPVRLDAKGYDALFAGLDRIEEARGLYRPITLNMVGFVLERQGGRLAAEPGRLIETYLRDCIAHGESKDFAAPVLSALITSEGTRAPHRAEAIAATTGLADWQVLATLSDLRRQGLVRPVGEIWEISHDFLARVIGQITGRLRGGWLARVATPTLAVAGIGWLVAMGIGVPAWVQWQEARALDGIHELGFSRLPDVYGGLSFSVRAADAYRIDNAAMEKFVALSSHIRPIMALNLSSARSVNDLAWTSGFPHLSVLSLRGTGIKSLVGIDRLPDLRDLDISLTKIRSLDGIGSSSNLQR